MPNTIRFVSDLPLRNLYSKVFYGVRQFGKCDKKVSRFEVTTVRSGENVLVYSDGYAKTIPMKDKWFWTLLGKTWEGKVRDAQRIAFKTTYLKWREEEKLDYQVDRLK